MHWATEMAKKIIDSNPDEKVYTVASGISPSGFVHIGNFREIATTYFVAEELKKLGKKVRFIFSWDDFDRLRKIPGDINSDYEKYIGMPYAKVPSPKEGYESYAHYLESKFESELKEMKIDIEYIYQNKEYQSKRYNDYIIIAMEKRKEIFDILAEFKTQTFSKEEREKYYPINLYCSECYKDTTKILSYDEKSNEVEYKCACGYEEKIKLKDATNIKLQWKIDWPMRWKIENVVFEPGGRDHSSATGSYNVSKKIAKEIFDFDAPLYISYDFIGIKGGTTKISSSSGNSILLSNLLSIYDKNIILWLYAKYKPSVPFDIALDQDVIRYYSEFDRYAKNFFNKTINDEVIFKNIELTEVEKNYIENVPFNYLAAFLPIVNYDMGMLKKIMEKENIKYNENLFIERVNRAEEWLKTYGKKYRIDLLLEKNVDYYNGLNDVEKAWLSKLCEELEGDFNNADKLQEALYDIPKDGVLEDKALKQAQRRFFKIIYNLLIDSDKGPKLGLFMLAIDKNKYLPLLTFK